MKICPLLSWEGNKLNCEEENCQWWVSFENIHRADVSGHCVLYAVGIVLYNMINGKKKKKGAE